MLSPKEDAKGMVNDTSGTPIRIREQKKFAKKAELRRRGGVYLSEDYFFQKFYKEHV